VKRRGNIVITVLFVLLLSFSGLALLTHSLLHSKIIGARRGKWQVAEGLETALVLQLHRYRQRLDASDMNQYAAPESDFFNAVNFPDSSVAGFRVKNQFSRQGPDPGSGFFKIRIFNLMTAGRENSRLSCEGRAAVDLLRGDIPLSEVSLLVSGEIAATQAEYLAGQGVEWPGSIMPLPGKPALEGDGRRLLAATLQLDGQFPDWRQIREKFGLEPGAAPIAPGIYLAAAAGRVKAVFIEGSLQRLEFSAAGGRQSIVFRRDDHAFELSYQPGRDSVQWNGRESVSGYGFSEKIFVHGSVWAIAQSGSAAFADGARLQVLASGTMTVTSGLGGENPGLQKGKFAHLLLMTCSRDFFSGDGIDADITLATGPGSTVEAHLLAAGSLVHGDGLVKVSGSLIAGAIRNSGRLQVDPLAGQFDFAAGLSLKNFQCLQNFRVHFISEGGDE
jgi:hypothetical protein